MKRLLLYLPMALMLAACRGEPAASEKTDEQGMAKKESGKTEGKQYPSLPEKQLKGIARTSFDSPNPTPAQLARRAKSIATLKKLGLPTLDSLPVVDDDNAVKLREPAEVASRCLATTFCAVKGESNDQAVVDRIIAQYSASSYFSPKEQAFITNKAPERQDLVDFCWRYECVHVFLWALDVRQDLAAPNAVCPVSEDMKLIMKIGPADFAGKAKLRPVSEILDQADLYYHLHWAAIELRLKGKKSEFVDEEIIRERHRALNWLIRYLNQEWDNVTTDT